MKETRDILFVAWIEVVKGKRFDSHAILDERRRLGVFKYEIPSNTWNEYKKEFYDSETTKTRYAVQRIKDLLN